MSLRETLLGAAEAKATQALRDAEVPTLAAPVAAGDVSMGFLVEEETQIGTRVVDPELAEAIARVKAMEWTKDELALIKSLTVSTIQTVLTNGSEKGKMAAAKLGVLMAKIERDNYLEMRKQSLENKPKQRRTLFQFPSQYLGQMQAGLREGLRDVTPAKEPKDA